MSGRDRWRDSFARHGGALAALVGLVVGLPIAGALTHARLRDAYAESHHDVAELLASSCAPGVVFDDPALVQETLDELAPRLGGLVSASVMAANGTTMGRWRAEGADQDVVAASADVVTTEGPRGRVVVEVAARGIRGAVGDVWRAMVTASLVSFLIALTAASLLDRSLREKVRMQGELVAAQRIQTAMVPQRVDIPGYAVRTVMNAASEVGGDFVDAIPTARGGWLAIGDVVGHGMSAGLVMVMIQSGFSSVVRAQPESDPRHIVAVLNDLLLENVHRRLGDAKHATMVVLELCADGRIRHAGGHLDLIVRRARTGRADWVRAEGPFVGLAAVSASDVELSALCLEPGDLLVAYTDGVIESRNAAGSLFGGERLLALVAQANDVDEVVERVMREVGAWSGSAPEDDVTVLACRFHGGRSSA